ncbi:peptidoglycan D,D-transpeptidase FtsI family protein [Desulforamulus hydrothermalis]|uniref:Peptidoglycan glycosyltransferase n=1 Tax=Desulforamulus hydrothermalis Lam5 = DSM 18033 TaxID=1121428 RepID=K8EJT0_9FIRM|nr:penicillin-binding transpeptidase domain-containing protein [Desulforamulus hydrothermalis]CCO08821.1 Peptidoglycan glycosyltransferase [Desulforamulus hydrothermalis Lam5 = DSM 18033]SHG72402.1 penicillin-binding protein 2 [Desulforamulus hydrothermalis Lam5 = DSM 18033]
MNIFQQKRLVLTFYVIFLLFVPLVIHLFFIQVLQGSEYKQKALEQRTLKVALEDIPRGGIFDRWGEKTLTLGRRELRVVVFPEIIPDKEEAVRRLSPILGCSPAELAKYVTGRPGYLPFKLDSRQLRQIKELEITGIKVEEIYFRYGSAPLAAHVVGHLGPITDNDQLAKLNNLSEKKYQLTDLVGKSGLEYFYESRLKAGESRQVMRAYVDVYRRLLAGLGIKKESQAVTGRQDVITTIDWEIQKTVEKVMDQKVQKGAVVVMDARNGDLLAMASRPNFHPANITQALAGPQDALLDHCTSLYQPGSVFKVVVAAAALEEGLVKASDTFVCLGESEHLISCWHKPGHGPITFEEAFAQSCNPVFAELAIKLGPAKIIAYARAFGLEEQTIIGYPVPRDNRQNLHLIGEPYNLVNSSIGQGPVLASPVQLTAMMNTVVNNGVYIRPRLVKGLRDEGGRFVSYFPMGRSHKVISSETARELKRLLSLVTSRGVGREAMLPYYGAAGKTGSAELPGGTTKVNAWFCGYAPLDKPQYIVTVLVEEGISGGVTAAPVFREIMEGIILPTR